MLEAIMAWVLTQFASLRETWTELLAKADAYNRVHDKQDIHIVGAVKNDVKVMIVGIVMVAIGVLLVSEFDNALPTISNTGLSSDYETTLNNFGTGLTIVGVLFIVIPAISILRRMDVI